MTTEKHYLAYHTPTHMPYGGSKISVHVLYTSKAAAAQAAARERATVWLIGRDEDQPGVFWYGWLTAEDWKPPHFPELDDKGELIGDPETSYLMPKDGGEPVLLDGRPWLKAALDVLGNGMYGLQALHREEVLAGLQALKRTPRMVSGRPRARRKP